MVARYLRTRTFEVKMCANLSTCIMWLIKYYIFSFSKSFARALCLMNLSCGFIWLSPIDITSNILRYTHTKYREKNYQGLSLTQVI